MSAPLGVVRFLVVLSLFGAGAGSTARGSPDPSPSPEQSSVSCLTLCPLGDRSLTALVRDEVGAPMPGVAVRVSFAACDSVMLCRPDGSDGYAFEHGRLTVSQSTDASGMAAFDLRGGGITHDSLAEVRANGVLLARRVVHSIDLDGDLEVDIEDLALFQDRWMARDPIADLDCSGIVNIADFNLFSAHYGHGGACDSAAYRLDVGTVGGGSVAVDPDLPRYDHGVDVVLTAIPGAGSFLGWSGDTAAAANTLTLTMDHDRSLVASFCDSGQVLFTEVQGRGSIQRSPASPCAVASDTVTLAAIPDPGWFFIEWGGDLGGRENPVSFVMGAADRHVTARFATPDTAQCEVPAVLRMCPGGDLSTRIVVRDTSGAPMSGMRLVVSFTGCDSMDLCLPDGSEAYRIEAGRIVISALTAEDGGFTFWIRGGGNCNPAGGATIRVTSADEPLGESGFGGGGVAIGSMAVASPDKDGDLSAADADCRRVCAAIPWCLLGIYCDPSCDLNLDGLVGSTDLAVCCWHSGCDSTTCDPDEIAPGVAGAGHACPSATSVRDLPQRSFVLHPAFPNPTTGAVRLVFELPRATEVSIVVHDVAGRRVRSALAGKLHAAGRHTWTWDGHDDAGMRVMTGIYFVRLRVDGMLRATRLVIRR